MSFKKKPKWLSYFGWAALFLGALFFLAVVFRAPLLTGLARWWSVGDQHLEKADAIVVLGGSIETRPFAAADLFHQGFAPEILVAQTELAPSTELGITPSHHELNIAVLTKKGVPESAISLLGKDVSSTRDELTALEKWSSETSKTELILITEIFPSRRLRWICNQQSDTTNLNLQIHTVPGQRHHESNWWQEEQGLISFQNEVIKYIYYRLKY